MKKDLNGNKVENQAALDHVKALAFTRKVGTDGETKGINYIQKELEKSDIDSNQESFICSSGSLMKLLLSFLFFYIILYEIFLFMNEYAWVILILHIILIFTLIRGMSYLLDWTKIIYWGKKSKSKNVIAKLSAKNSNQKKPVAIFSAHYDTISRLYPGPFYMILMVSCLMMTLTFLFLTEILAIWSLISIFFAPTARMVIIFQFMIYMSLILAISIQTCVIIAIFNKSLDKSVGSLDNATGVAILIELAKLIKKNPLEKIDVLFLWFGAEEYGLWGSRQYLAKHFDELNDEYDLDKSIAINIDIIGSYVGLMDETGLIKKKRMNERLNDIIFATAKQSNIQVKKQKAIIGTGGDHMCFKTYALKKEKSLQVTCFASNKDARYIHYPSDTPDRCSAKSLNDCITVCHETVRSIDKRVESDF